MKITPRCLLYNMPVFLSADNKLKPCCFLNPTEPWKQFLSWGRRNGHDVENDLDITKHSVDTIMKSRTWLAILDGFETGNVPGECRHACGPDSYNSTTQTAKHSDYDENLDLDSSGNSSHYEGE
jgi:hypothetical protein